MNKLIKVLMISSLMATTPLVANAQTSFDEIANRENRGKKYEYPLKEDSTPYTSYGDSKYPVANWMSLFDNDVRVKLNKDMQKRLSEDDTFYLNVSGKASQYQTDMLMTLLYAEWNHIKNNYPDEKNAVVAFCKYGKMLNVLNDKVKECNKDFQFNNSVSRIKVKNKK